MDIEKEKNISEDSKNEAEEVSFLVGSVKTSKKDNEAKEAKIKNKREPINKRTPVNVGSTIKNDDKKSSELPVIETETAVSKTEEAKKEEPVKETAVKEEAKAEETKKEESAQADASETKTENKAEASKAEEEIKAAAEKTENEEKAAGEQPKDEEPAEEVIIFAAAPKPVKTKKIEQQKFEKKKHSFPIIPLAACVAVLALAAVGAMMVINSNNAPEVADPDESIVSEQEKNAGASDGEDSLEETLDVIRETSAEIKTINTASIVFGDNVTVSGVKVAGKTLSEAYDALQNRLKDLRDDINIEINCGTKHITLNQDDFSFDTDLSGVLIQAYHYSRGELDEPTVPYADNGGVMDFTVTSVINKNSISNAVKKVAEKFDVQPKDAHVKSFNPEAAEKFTYEKGSDGYLISQKLVNEEITKILLQPEKHGGFSVEAVRTPYTKTLESVKANTKLIGSHCTTANNVWASVYNMELAIKSCNGYVVKPGQTFSFNEMTGDTTTGALGYVPSTAIVGGKYEQQYGGGICQAATTIYIAAMKAGMEAIERHAHQYASVYADRGIDATVDYGSLDMKFKNNFEYPVYIATYVYDYNGDGCDELCVEFYGPISAEYDEIVPIGWINYIGNSDYGAAGAQVYFKDGKEVKREYLPDGVYDYHGESYYSLSSEMPSDVEYGPREVSPTGNTPTIYSPNGCGSSAPVPYGTAAQYLTAQPADN